MGLAKWIEDYPETPVTRPKKLPKGGRGRKRSSNSAQHPAGKRSAGTLASKAKAQTKPTHPSEWSVDQVVEWLQSKGFGSDVYDKFIEHQITGNVLLELDINLLKEEIGIAAFGDRMRITNAIAEFHRSPSVILADDQPHAQSITHSVSQSFSDAHSLSGSTLIGSPSVGSPDSLNNPEVDTFTSPRISKRVSSMSTASSSVFAGVEKAGIFQVAGLGLGALPETRLSSAPEEELHEDYNVQSEDKLAASRQHHRCTRASAKNKLRSETPGQANPPPSPTSSRLLLFNVVYCP
ncbi:hypothetical protein V8E55_001599 [Tylopilus felleus]|jgi:hypothetical protein